MTSSRLTTHRSARLHRSRLAILVALALHAVVAPARAEEVQTDLTGKVLIVSLSPSAPAGLAAALQAHGVVVGANASVSFRVESTTRPTPNGSDFAQYHGAITSMTIQIGSYTASQLVPPGLEMLNLIQVGDNVSGPPVGDSVLMSTPGIDTDDLLHGALPGSVTLNVSVFDFSGPNASSDDGVIQDAKKYDFGNAAVGGGYGSINITLNLSGGGGGGGGKNVGPGFCRKAQLLAASKLGRKVFQCTARRAQQPSTKDPLGQKEQACLDKAGDLFEVQFAKSLQKAMKKGGMCTLASLGAEGVTEDLLAAVDGVVQQVIAGADTDNPKDRALRAKLLRAAAGQWGKDAAAYAVDAFKPNATKLLKKLGASRSRLEAQAAKAIAAATKKGVVYAGPDGPALANAVRAAVEDFLELAGGTPAPD